MSTKSNVIELINLIGEGITAEMLQKFANILAEAESGTVSTPAQELFVYCRKTTVEGVKQFHPCLNSNKEMTIYTGCQKPVSSGSFEYIKVTESTLNDLRAKILDCKEAATKAKKEEKEKFDQKINEAANLLGKKSVTSRYDSTKGKVTEEKIYKSVWLTEDGNIMTE